MRRGKLVTVALALVLSALAVVPGARAETPPGPVGVFTLPPDGIRGHALWDSWYELEPFGYEEQEYFVSGTATTGTVSAPYVTRVIVMRPRSLHDFNGTVLLDWVNVTARFENAVDTMEAREMLMREGFAYVHVSAQEAGVDGTPLTPKKWDPVRYEALSHPGDQFAADMFTQIARGFATPRAAAGGVHPLGGLGPARRIIAAGQSQSAGKLSAYVRDVQPSAGVIDGFLIHGGGARAYEQPLPAKVLHLQSDAEASDAPTDDDPSYRLWEVAGTAHSDFFIGYQSVVGLGPRVIAGAPKRTVEEYRDVIDAAGNYGEQPHPMQATCVVAGATMPMHYAASSAIYQLDRWVRGDGFTPKHGPRLVVEGETRALDEHGNSLGGIRLPPVDVPVATYLTDACSLGGLTVPFTEVQLLALYPTFEHYRSAMQARTDQAVREGWLLEEDAVDLMRRVCRASNRWPLSTATCPPYVPPRWNSA